MHSNWCCLKNSEGQAWNIPEGWIANRNASQACASTQLCERREIASLQQLLWAEQVEAGESAVERRRTGTVTSGQNPT